MNEENEIMDMDVQGCTNGFLLQRIAVVELIAHAVEIAPQANDYFDQDRLDKAMEVLLDSKSSIDHAGTIVQNLPSADLIDMIKNVKGEIQESIMRLKIEIAKKQGETEVIREFYARTRAWEEKIMRETNSRKEKTNEQ